MEWLLLYPLIGVLVFPWHYRNEKRYLKREQRFNGVQNLLGLIILWPVALWVSPQDWEKGAQVLEAEREREFQALETRVRREARARVRQEFAEFDKALGIEPEPHWRRTHPAAAIEYDNNMEIARLHSVIQETSWEPEYSEVRTLSDEVVFRGKNVLPHSGLWYPGPGAQLTNYSKGGRV